MRFDPERVVAHAGGAGEAVSSENVDPAREADEFVARFSAIGWRTERVSARSTSLPPIPVMGLLLGWFMLELQRVDPGLSPVVRAGLAGLLIAPFVLAFASSARRTFPAGVGIPPLHIFATDRGERPSPARLVLFTRLADTWPPMWSLGLISRIVVLMLPGTVLLIPRTFDLPRVYPLAAWGVLISQGIFLWLLVGKTRARGLDRTGFPTLAELARTWPKGVGNQVETWAVATHDMTDLARVLGRRFHDGTPTLAVAIDSPGMGPDLVIAGRGEAAELAADAASALWVPHRRSRFIPGGVGHQGYGWNGIPCVSLLGRRDNPAIDPAALARVAQLVTEIAFRWGKRATAAQEVSRARSSQNPG